MNHLLKLSSAHLFCHFISRNEEDLVISYRDESISYEIILLSGAYSGLWEPENQLSPWPARTQTST